MRLNEIISLRETLLETFYLHLTEEQQDSFVLIEDTKDGKLLISYSKDNHKETINPLALGLHANTWSEGTYAVRIDSHRFLSEAEQFGDSYDVLEARLVCKKIHEKISGHERQDEVDAYLRDLIFMIQTKDTDIQGLFVLNGELDEEISILSPSPHTQDGELYPEPDPESYIDISLLSEPIQ